MTAVATAGAGFLLAVLWFDLMFDVQLLGGDRREPDEAVASIAAYYRRVTTGASPMNYLVALAMLVTLAALAAEIGGDEVPAATAWASLALAVPAIAIAVLHTVPAARPPRGAPRRTCRTGLTRPLDPPRPPRQLRPDRGPARRSARHCPLEP